MHKIGIISDTHGLLRPEVVKLLNSCDTILHGGDINKPEILEQLEQIAPTYAVRGNTDREWAQELPLTRTVELYGFRFFMIHDVKKISKALHQVDIVVFGHSHAYTQYYEEQQLWLNPGSCGPKRFSQPVTCAVLEIADEHTYDVKRVEIEQLQNSKREKGVPADIQKVIKSVMRDTDRGLSIGQMAAKNRISEELAEQICRLYVTHPGVSADEILAKMGTLYPAL